MAHPVAPLTTTVPLPPGVIVALGAVPGAWIRFAIVRGAATRLRHGHWATWLVNTLACFLLGLVVGLQPLWEQATRSTLELGLAIGFLGSMSTFSTLIGELVTAWRHLGRGQALGLALASLVGGLLACQLGLRLALGWR
ncbi:MAG: CrcB family protein [Cyanobacteriota bacterium]|nr:CrcB family protein [Cyanobacteriota bacterium]